MSKNKKHRAVKRISIQAKRVGIGRDERHKIRTYDRAHTAALAENAKRKES